MILLTLSRGKGEETVRLQLPASPAEIGETFAFLDRISLDTTATAILDVSSNVPVLYRCLYDVDVEDSEQFQKLQKLAERTEALSPAKAAIFSGALDAECVWNLEGALTVADRLDEYMLVNNVSSDSELGIYLVNKGITPFPDRFKPYINYARVGAEYREKHGGEYSSGNYVQKKTPELLENERLDGVFRIWMENPCPVRVQSETAQITLPATFEQLESARQLLGVDSLNMAKLTRVEALRPYLGEYPTLLSARDERHVQTVLAYRNEVREWSIERLMEAEKNFFAKCGRLPEPYEYTAENGLPMYSVFCRLAKEAFEEIIRAQFLETQELSGPVLTM